MSVQDLRKLAAELRGRLPVATEAAARVCAALKAGTRPETGDVDLILRALTDFDGARVRLMEGRSEGPMPETFEMLSQALDAAAAEASRSERLRGLVGIQGPPALENVLEEVRQAARTGRSPQLELLAELIALAADTGDFQELDDTAELARERLPGTWRPLINAALNRRLETEEPERPRPQAGAAAEAGSPTGAQETGSQETGSQETGPQETGPQGTGSARPEGERGLAPAVSLRKSTERTAPETPEGTAQGTEAGSAPGPGDGDVPATVQSPAGAGDAAGDGKSDVPGTAESVAEGSEVGDAPGPGRSSTEDGEATRRRESDAQAPADGATPAPLGAPPAFGAGVVEASEIVLEFAEQIGPPIHDERGRPDEPDPPAGTGSNTAKEGPAGTPAVGEPQAGTHEGETAATETSAPAQAGTEGPRSGITPAHDLAAGPQELEASKVRSPQAGPGQAGPGQAGSVAGASRGHRVVGSDGAGTAGRTGKTGTAEAGTTEAEVAALRSARFGLAAWLRTAAGRPAAEAQARRCAGLARAMGDFAGRLSAEFSAAAQGLDARSLADDPAGGILAWAAAIRAGIVHPTPESIRLLDDLVPVVSPYPGLSAYGEAFADAADSGAYLVPGGTTDGRGTQAGQNRQRAVRASVRLLEEGPHRRLEPALVEETWRALVQQDAPLGRLLTAAARDDTARVDEVADQVAALRVGGAVGELINDTVRWVAGGPVESTTTIWLGGMIGDALEMVARWVSAVKGTASVGTDRLTQALAELRAAIERNEELAAAELSGPVAAGGPVPAAAAGAARVLIRETLELLDGAPVQTTEPPYAHVVNRELLLAPAVQVHPATLVPYEPPALADLIPVALAPEEEWEAAFEARAAQGDHEGTRAIIAVLERQEPDRVLPLRLRREELVRAARSARDERVRDLRARMAQGMRDGALSGDAAARIEKTLQDLTGPLRDDFGRVHGVLHGLETEIARGAAHNLKLLGGAAGSAAPQP
ncbi:hypothetical protein ACRYCC_43055 [Actinomadura scrupuli]|uniref:hypothetical protein n=1 Tax=Actinomadura scrupuli TaxID=559629 RepID=UPI003D96083F